VLFSRSYFHIVLSRKKKAHFAVHIAQKHLRKNLHFNQKVEVHFFRKKGLIFSKNCCIITLQSREIAQQKRTAKVRT